MSEWREVVQEVARQAAKREMTQSENTRLNYRWEHVQAVVITALRLAALLDADQEVVEAAAWLHDVAKGAKGKSDQVRHGLIGAEMARDLLVNTDFPPGKIAAVVDAIAKHVGLVKEHLVEPIEAAVLWDADKLTKLGPIVIVHEALLAAQRQINLKDTSEVGKWVLDQGLGPRIAASMNTSPALRAAQRRVLATGDFCRQLDHTWAADDLVERPGYKPAALRIDGRDGVLWSPLYRVRVELAPVEQALLQTWPVRRLHFLHHNGVNTVVYPLTVSRLQHTLGVFTLVAHFCPSDIPLRVAALLHDVGHYPFCHSAELLPGVDHHAMTHRRVTGEPICAVLRAHGLDPNHVLALMDGDPPNPLRTRNGLLHLDHLDSWVREAQVVGLDEMPAHALLAGLSLEGNNVAADWATAEYLVRIIHQGNTRHYAEGDIGPGMVLAHLVKLSLERRLITMDELADATDEALLARLAATGDDEVTGLIDLLRREPWRIVVRKLAPGEVPPPDALTMQSGALYDAVPLMAGMGKPITKVSSTAREEMARVKVLAGTYVITWKK